MPIDLRCPCGRTYPVREEFAGQQVECPSCRRVLAIPAQPPRPRHGPGLPDELRDLPAAHEPYFPPPRDRATGNAGLLAVVLVLLLGIVAGVGFLLLVPGRRPGGAVAQPHAGPDPAPAPVPAWPLPPLPGPPVSPPAAPPPPAPEPSAPEPSSPAEPPATPAANAHVLLYSPDPVLRRRAAEALGALGPEGEQTARPALLRALTDANVEVVAAAARALENLGPARSRDLPSLLVCLREDAAGARRYAFRALASLAGEAEWAVPLLAWQASKEKEAELRRLALETLVKIRAERAEAVEAFTQALADSEATVRRQAVQGLLAAGSVPGLVQALLHDDPEVHTVAAEALREAPLTRAHVRLLAGALESRREAVRASALAGLGRLGQEAAAAVPAVCRVLRAAAGAERRQALEALERIGADHPAAAAVLAELLQDQDPALRFEAALVLARAGGDGLEPALPLLVRALRPEDPEKNSRAKELAAVALVKAGRPAVHRLGQALETDFAGGPVVTPQAQAQALARLAVLEVLAAMGPRGRTAEALQVLARLEARDPVPEVRTAARQARLAMQKEQ